MPLCWPVRIVLGAGALAMFASLAPAKEPARVVVEEDFETGAGRWRPTDKDAWKVATTERGQVYSQFKKQSDYQPPFRSPYNLSLLEEVNVGDFQLDVAVRSTHPDYGHRDVCLVFGYQDPGSFYYVHLGKQTDDHANQIFIVDGEARKKISTKTSSGTNWDDAWHHVRIVRNVESGEIQIFFDDLSEPVMTATDKRFVWGQVGLGSFDDLSDWDDFRLEGTTAEKPQP